MTGRAETALACQVIRQAVRDFKFRRGKCVESYRFLTGDNPMAFFWFDAVGLPYFKGSAADVLKVVTRI